jgi:hypothetical protein
VKVGADADFKCHKPCQIGGAAVCKTGQTCTNAGLGGIIGMCRLPF